LMAYIKDGRGASPCATRRPGVIGAGSGRCLSARGLCMCATGVYARRSARSDYSPPVTRKIRRRRPRPRGRRSARSTGRSTSRRSPSRSCTGSHARAVSRTGRGASRSTASSSRSSSRAVRIPTLDDRSDLRPARPRAPHLSMVRALVGDRGLRIAAPADLGDVPGPDPPSAPGPRSSAARYQRSQIPGHRLLTRDQIQGAARPDPSAGGVASTASSAEITASASARSPAASARVARSNADPGQPRILTGCARPHRALVVHVAHHTPPVTLAVEPAHTLRSAFSLSNTAATRTDPFDTCTSELDAAGSGSGGGSLTGQFSALWRCGWSGGSGSGGFRTGGTGGVQDEARRDVLAG